METINKIKSKKYCPVHTLKVPFLEVKWLELGEFVKKKGQILESKHKAKLHIEKREL